MSYELYLKIHGDISGRIGLANTGRAFTLDEWNRLDFPTQQHEVYHLALCEMLSIRNTPRT